MRKYPLLESLYFTRTEKRASLVLSTICTICFILPHFYGAIRPKAPEPDFEEFRRMIAPAIAQMEMHESEGEENAVVFRGEKTAPAELFSFNPNTVSKDELVRLGLSPRTAQTVLNYRNKGGQFQKAADFKKLYTLRPEDYERLAPFIDIPTEEANSSTVNFEKPAEPLEVEHFHFDPNTASKEDFLRLGLPGRTAHSILNYRSKGGRFSEPADFSKIYTLSETDFQRLQPWITIAEISGDELTPKNEEERSEKFPKKEWVLSQIDVNQASPKDWEQFRGIGPGFAKRIVNFRKELGGFHSIEQVAETYGLPDSTFQSMRAYLELSSGVFQPLQVNRASLEELKAHPYLNKTQATILFNYRKQHGTFSDFEKMKNIRAGFKETDWKRLEPYLSFE